MTADPESSPPPISCEPSVSDAGSPGISPLGVNWPMTVTSLSPPPCSDVAASLVVGEKSLDVGVGVGASDGVLDGSMNVLDGSVNELEGEGSNSVLDGSDQVLEGSDHVLDGSSHEVVGSVQALDSVVSDEVHSLVGASQSLVVDEDVEVSEDVVISEAAEVKGDDVGSSVLLSLVCELLSSRVCPRA